ncbi:MAG: prepilin peptidase [Candidatus Anammoxibacter sp.]
MEIIVTIWSIFFGFTIGSFLNVCIYRIPLDKSIIFPGSHCTKCNNMLSWYDNIPILSYLILKGRCRKCKSAISVRYVFVELFSGFITGGLLQLLFFSGNKSLEVVIVYIILCYLLIIITFIDLEYLIVPNSLTYSGMIFVLVLSIILPGIFNDNNFSITKSFLKGERILDSFIFCLLGMLISGGIVFFTAIMGRIILKKDAMGIGDVKLMCMSGGIIGWKLGIVVFFIAPFFGICMAIPMIMKKNTRLIPYAPFLSLAIILVICMQSYFTEKIDVYVQFIKYLI